MVVSRVFTAGTGTLAKTICNASSFVLTQGWQNRHGEGTFIYPRTGALLTPIRNFGITTSPQTAPLVVLFDIGLTACLQPEHWRKTMYDPSAVLFILFTALIVINMNRPLVALAAFMCIGVVCLTSMQLLPIWTNAVASIIFFVVNAVDHFSKR